MTGSLKSSKRNTRKSTVMHEIFAIQHYNGTIWHTIYLSSFPSDVLDTFLDLTQATQASLRLVVFTVDNYDFIATHARGFSLAVSVAGRHNV